MKKNKWMLLQLFADGGDGGAPGGDGAGASETGVTGVDAEHQRLLELGVPEEKLRKRAKRAQVQLPAGAVRTAEPAKQQEAPNPQEQAAAADKPKEEPETGAKRMTWDEIKADPEYSGKMQEMVQARLKNVKQAQTDLDTLTPALQLIAKEYGLDPDKLDYAALAQKVTQDDKFFQDKAMQMGTTPEIARKLDQFDAMQKRQQEEQAKTLQEQRMQQHYQGLLQQGEALKQKYPGFDLQKELKNPVFARMTAPGVGLSVEDAYFSVHRKEIEDAAMQVTAQRTAQQISNAIQAGASRPQENGVASQAPSVTSFNYRNASREQREALKRAIREAGARGEKLYPGR